MLLAAIDLALAMQLAAVAVVPPMAMLYVADEPAVFQIRMWRMIVTPPDSLVNRVASEVAAAVGVKSWDALRIYVLPA